MYNAVARFAYVKYDNYIVRVRIYKEYENAQWELLRNNLNSKNY